MLVVTEGGFKAIALCSNGLPAIALLGVEMGLTVRLVKVARDKNLKLPCTV